ncbi:hypothetical protein GLYMA_18G167833v4 [Glycine max]|nr:hypothetical protein GLYMA_18G167833v4 [Glycine max]
MLIHQNNSVDPSHLNGLSVSPGSQTVEKVDQIMPVMQGQNLYPGSGNRNQPSKPLVPAHSSNHSQLQQKLHSGPANTTLKQPQPVVSPSDNSIEGHVLSVTAGHMASPPQPAVASNHHQLPLQSQPPYKQSNQTQSNVQRMLQQNCQVQSESSSMSQSDSPKVDQHPANRASQVSTNTAMSPVCMDAASVTVVPPSGKRQNHHLIPMCPIQLLKRALWGAHLLEILLEMSYQLLLKSWAHNSYQLAYLLMHIILGGSGSSSSHRLFKNKLHLNPSNLNNHVSLQNISSSNRSRSNILPQI